MMNIAFTLASGRGETNLLLSEVADRLAAAGLTLCGTVQVDTERADTHHCDMDVKVLPDGPTIRISQSLGAEAKGCRLDPEALESAVAMTQKNLAGRPDLLIVNKFGKHEAEGRGFREVIAEALAQEIPVLVGLNKLNAEAFYDFCPEGTDLAPDVEAIVNWVLKSTQG